MQTKEKHVKDVDMVNSPSHYNEFSQEVIVTIKEWIRAYTDPFIAYCIGNVLKYISRAPFKGRFNEDLAKAGWYLNKANEHIESKNQKDDNKEFEDGKKL